MKHGFVTASAVFFLAAGGAFAQTTSTDSTTTTSVTPAPVMAPAPVLPPPPGTLSTTVTQHAVDANGDQYDSSKTIYGNANGAASDSTQTLAVPPVPPVVTKQTTTTTSTSN